MSVVRSCEIPKHHPAYPRPHVVYIDSEGRPWKRVKNLNSKSQDSPDFVRYGIDEALALVAVGSPKARKTVYP